MSTTVFLFHPNLESSRVNAKLANIAASTSDVTVRDLYSIYPKGDIDVTVEQEALEQADRIVLQFPMHWYSSPSLLKQWEDDVLQYGWAFGSSGTALHGKELTIAVSTGASGYSRQGTVGYTVTELLRPFQATSNLIGTTFLTPFIIEGSLGLPDDKLEKLANSYREYLTADLSPLDAYE